MMRAALARDLPVLAICRGSQVLNVALGGGIEQHVPDRVAADTHKETPGVFAEHDVDVLGDTKLASIVGDRTDVKSHHHQGFGEFGAGLRESARADDGTVEALEDPTRRFTLGVLWHPEEGEDMALFEALVADNLDLGRPRLVFSVDSGRVTSEEDIASIAGQLAELTHSFATMERQLKTISERADREQM